MNLEEMTPALKEQFCEQVYQNYIVDSSCELTRYKEYAGKIHAKMPVSCYTNFRDALFHFRRVVYSVEKSEIERQAFAVQEHLARSLTDAGSSILYHLTRVAETLLEDEKLDKEVKACIRKSLHELKKANIRKRFGGMMLSDDGILSVSHTEIQGLIENLYELLDNKCPEEFAKYSIEVYNHLNEKEEDKIQSAGIPV